MYANQKKVSIDKPKKEHFAIYGLAELATACKVLSYSGLRVGLYLLSNNDGYSGLVSPAHAEKYWGINRSSFYRGRDELVEKGFLVEGTMHQTSTMEMSQIEKKSRKYHGDTDGMFNVEQSMYQSGDSNNTINNTNNNMDTSSPEAGSILGQPEEKEFVF